jgi:hypothetical protein
MADIVSTAPPSISQSSPPVLRTRGVVLTPGDLTDSNWPERAHRAGLTTIALHPTPEQVVPFVQSEAGEAFLSECEQWGLRVEYELHALRYLLPRALFQNNRCLFRMSETGERVPEGNLCVHSQEAVEIVCQNAIALSRLLRPSTGRYFLWGDDAAPWCRCPKCRGLSDSEQALIMANRLVRALRQEESQAQVAHLAYHNTLAAPRRVQPEAGVFLEYAPIHRRYDIPYSQQNAAGDKDSLAALDANLSVFGADDAQVLEYWLDASLFSGWKRPAVRLPWDGSVFVSDVATYRSRGIRHITSFSVYLDAQYVACYGEPPLDEYGAGLLGSRQP